MKKTNYPSEFLRLLNSVKAKRPKTVINHILEYGQITTEELKDIYGYSHPPRAIRDVREQGIPIKTFRVLGADGRKIAAYKFGAPSEVRAAQLSGRTVFSENLKKALTDDYSLHDGTSPDACRDNAHRYQAHGAQRRYPPDARYGFRC